MQVTSPLPPAIILTGPTASGKTDLALRLCDQLPLEIISVDSALVYRGMDIGTAKPDKATLSRYPHHLVDILDPSECYSAARFRQETLDLMQSITQRGKVPFLVGGTMLYLRTLLYGLSELPEADPKVRADIESMAEKYGWSYIHQQLANVDPVAAARIHPNDPQRLQRALEVYRLTGISMTEWQKRQPLQGNSLPYKTLTFALAPEKREILHLRIATRFRKMIQYGFLEEVESLMSRGDLHPGLPSIRSVGYRQAWDYLLGKTSLEQMQEQGIAATRQLAKRQFTWLRGWQDLIWLYTSDADERDARDDLLARLSATVLTQIERCLQPTV